MVKKRIGVITASRAEYGILELILREIESSSKLELILFVSGMHLLSKFGTTIKLVRENFHNIVEVEFYDFALEFTNKYISSGISKGIQGFTTAFTEHPIDFLLVLGDRVEILAAAIAAACLKIPIGHIHGGDVADDSQIDGQIRHAITKFSHIHFAATDMSAERILQMGEEKWRVFRVGAPGLEIIQKEKLMERPELIHYLSLERKISDEKQYILCVFHPSIINQAKSGYYFQLITDLLKKYEYHVIIIYPNNDPGNELIISEIKKLKNFEQFTSFVNLPRKVYLSLLKYAFFMIGNSSSGIIESHIFNIPVINVGKRNLNRENAGNVFFVDYSQEEIKNAIEKIRNPNFRRIWSTENNPYFMQDPCSQNIRHILENLTLDYSILDKKFIKLKCEYEDKNNEKSR